MWRVAARLLCRCPAYILAVAPRTLLKLATPLLNLFEQYDKVRFWPFDASLRRFRRVGKKFVKETASERYISDTVRDTAAKRCRYVVRSI